VVAAAAAAATATAAGDAPPLQPPLTTQGSGRVPRGGCLNTLQASLDAAAAPVPVVEEVRTRAAGVKHIGFGPFKRENQDEFAISLGQGFGGALGGNLFCVFDGHGACGKDAAAYARQQLPLLLDAEMRAYAARSGGDGGGGEAALKGAVEVLLAEAFADAERALQRAGVNLASSGTTATVVYQRGNRLWVASAGDSRVVLCSRVDGGGGGGGSEGGGGAVAAGASSGGRGAAGSNQQQQQQQQMTAAAQALLGAVSAGGEGGLDDGGLSSSSREPTSGGGAAPNNPTADADGAGVAGPPRRLQGVQGVWRAQPLTIDHRPRRMSERERVEAAGGRVAPKRLPSGRAVGEPRLWLADLPSPGLLLSRSLGDLMAASVGCTSDPEVTYCRLRPGVDRYMVLASDGVWDVLGNAQVCELVAGAGDPHSACRRVLDAALGEWEERMSADNVTVVVVEFDWGQGGGGGGAGVGAATRSGGGVGGGRVGF
jgi:serine/threonine protein phosphatase PrpC